MILGSCNTDGGIDAILAEEQDAAARELCPVRARVVLVPLSVKRSEESLAAEVLTCERKGSVFSSFPNTLSSETHGASAWDCITLDVVFFRSKELLHDGLDDTFTTSINSTHSKRLLGVQPLLMRLTMKEKGPGGCVCDCCAIDLREFLVGRYGSVEKTLILQLGTEISLRVETTIVSVGTVYSHDELRQPANEHCDRPTASLLSEAIGEQSREIPRTPNSAKNHADVTDGFCAAPPTNFGAANSNGQITEETSTEIVGAASAVNQALCSAEGSEIKSEYRIQETSSSGMQTLTNLEQDPSVTNKTLGEGKQSALDGDNSDSSNSCGNLQCVERTHGRTSLSTHPFYSLVSRRAEKTKYSCELDEGVIWEETPVVTFIQSPLPISVWSIQGPSQSESDKDEESDADEMMDIGGGDVAPKRDIQKLQAAASCSNTKQGPPASQGIMSPLQMTYFKPSLPVSANVIRFGRPRTLSKRSVLEVSRFMHEDFIRVEEPDLSDEEQECEEDEDDESEGSSEEHCVEEKITELLEMPQVSNDAGVKTDNPFPARESSSRASPPDELMYSLQSLDDSRPQGDEISSDNDTSTTKLILSLPDCIERESCDNSSSKESQTTHLSKKLACMYAELHTAKNSLSVSKQNFDLIQAGVERVADLFRSKSHDENESESVIFEKPDEESSIYDSENFGINFIFSEAKKGLRAREELKKLKHEIDTDTFLRQENARLLQVILTLKTELDREPGTSDILNELKRVKSELAMERIESEKLRHELLQLRGARMKKSRGMSLFNLSPRASKEPEVSDTEVEESPRSIQEYM